jgi:hypothetical protein
MSGEVTILEPRRPVIVTPEMRARAARQIEEYRQRHASLAVEDVSDGTAETVAAAVGATIDSALGRVTGYGGSLDTECTVEHKAGNGAVTTAKLKFRYDGRR